VLVEIKGAALAVANLQSADVSALGVFMTPRFPLFGQIRLVVDDVISFGAEWILVGGRRWEPCALEAVGQFAGGVVRERSRLTHQCTRNEICQLDVLITY
jgi:hypothetical protein